MAHDSRFLHSAEGNIAESYNPALGRALHAVSPDAVGKSSGQASTGAAWRTTSREGTVRRAGAVTRADCMQCSRLG